MARAGVHYVEVKEAAEALLRENLNPTNERIRQRLGSGSFSTISKYLLRWRSEDAPPELRAPTRPNIAAPPSTVEAAVQDVWQRMQDATHARIVDAQKTAEELIDAVRSEAETAIDDARATAIKAEAARDALVQEIESIRKELRDARTQHAESMAVCAQLKTQCDAEERARMKAEQHAAQSEAMLKSLNDARDLDMQRITDLFQKIEQRDAKAEQARLQYESMIPALLDRHEKSVIQDLMSESVRMEKKITDGHSASHAHLVALSDNLKATLETHLKGLQDATFGQQTDLRIHITQLSDKIAHQTAEHQSLVHLMTSDVGKIIDHATQNTQTLASAHAILKALMTSDMVLKKSA